MNNWVPTWRAVLAGVVTFSLLILLQLVGIFDGYLSIVITAIVLIALPTSRYLSRRILLIGAISIGVAPLLWMVPIQVFGMGRTPIVVNAIAAGLCAWIAFRPFEHSRRILPKFSAIDLVPIAIGGGSAFYYSVWLRAKSPDGALSTLLAGWDNSAHYAMTQAIRKAGSTYESTGQTLTGEMPAYTNYPKGFHSLAASIIELLTGTNAPQSVAAELVAFNKSVGLVAVCSVVLVAAGLCSLPKLRRRPGIALVATTMVAVFFVLGPGGQLVGGGFINFYLACAACVAAICIALTMPRFPMPLHLTALLGAVIGVAYGWVLLLAFALPAAIIAMIPFRRSHWRASRTAWILSGAAMAIGVAAVLRTAVILLTTLAPDEVFVTSGGIPAPSLILATITAMAAIAACLFWVSNRKLRDRVQIRESWLALVPLSGAVVGGMLALYQVTQTGALSYYFLKFTYGLLLVSIACAAIAFSHILCQTISLVGLQQYGKRKPAAFAMTLALISTQIFGYAPLGFAAHESLPASESMTARANLIGRNATPSAAISAIIAAASIGQTDPNHRYYALFPKYILEYHPIMTSQWAFALAGAWTAENNTALVPLSKVAFDGPPEPIVDAINQLLDENPRSIVLTDPDTLATYLKSSPDQENIRRVRSV